MFRATFLPGGPLGASGLWRHTKACKTAPPSTPAGRCAKWVLCSSTLAPHSAVSWSPPFLPRPRSPHSLAGRARLACIRWSKRPTLSNRSACRTRGTRSESLPYRSAGCTIADLICSRSRDHRPEARRRSFRGTDPSKIGPSCLHGAAVYEACAAAKAFHAGERLMLGQLAVPGT
jgi:hypothetical protein